jgi:hypothetical protein
LDACEVDLVGVYYTAADEAGSTITPNCSDVVIEDCLTGPELCVAGVGAEVLDGEYGVYWGTVFGLALCDPETGACPSPPDFDPVVDDWQPDSYGFTEISFHVTGDAPNLRLNIQTVDGAQYCGTVEYLESISLTSLTEECWFGGGTPYAGQPIAHIQWQIPTQEFQTTSFDFCLEDVRLE